MTAIKKAFGVSDAAPMTPKEMDLRLLQELSLVWQSHVRRYARDCRALKKRAAAARDVTERYEAAFEYQHCLLALRDAFAVWRSIRADLRAVWGEYLDS